MNPFNFRSLLRFSCAVVLLSLLVGCAPTAAPPPSTAPAVIQAAPTGTPPSVPPAAAGTPTFTPPEPTAAPTPTQPALTEEEKATLGSLKKLDDYPLYTLQYSGDYPSPYLVKTEDQPQAVTGSSAWACSLFAALGDPKSRLFGRDFDWRFSPAVLLFTDPSDGYASVSMVDIEYLDFSGERSKNLESLSLDERRSLLDAPSLPFDGMNEKGLAVGMASVPSGNMPIDPNKPTIDELAVIREILDHAATVDEAVDILSRYNIDMSEVPIHYLIASAAGESALVEFYQGEMAVFRNSGASQYATNFLLAAAGGHPQGEDYRYDRIDRRMSETGGWLDVPGAMQLLSDVSQSSGSRTQWSVVYNMTAREISVVMGRAYSGEVHHLKLDQTGP